MAPQSPAALLDANARWAKAVNQSDPGFFLKTTEGQFPKILWFGCSDSRVPESVITDCRPGDLFVHRNVANQFHPDDDSALAVISYAIETVGVEHIILAGHTHCGGAKACLEAAIARQARSAPRDTSDDGDVDIDTDATINTTGTPLGRWLASLIELAGTLDDLEDTNPILERLVYENVKRQVANICDAAPVREAWAAGKPISVHGWVCDLASGRIKDLGISRGPPSDKK